MYQVKLGDMDKVSRFFEKSTDTLIWSCLQGHMGHAYVDHLEQPTAAAVIVADFCFLAGEVSKEVVERLFEVHEGTYLLVIAEDEGWHQALEEGYKDKHSKFMRYAIKKEKDVFDKVQLQDYVDSLPEKFHIKQIDEVLYQKTKEEEWSCDLCAQFPTYDDYATRGLGYVVMHEDEVVSGVSSYTIYDEGIEIEVDTRPDYRRQGLALACAAKLILECLDRGLYPSWDAANQGSVALAEKLGYHFDKEYMTYYIEK
ncbi:MAG: GNAT family N-acetyltransferase [Cellulosilyticaceae bacterium]